MPPVTRKIKYNKQVW